MDFSMKPMAVLYMLSRVLRSFSRRASSIATACERGKGGGGTDVSVEPISLVPKAWASRRACLRAQGLVHTLANAPASQRRGRALIGSLARNTYLFARGLGRLLAHEGLVLLALAALLLGLLPHLLPLAHGLAGDGPAAH
jgi:hypothetical protein